MMIEVDIHPQYQEHFKSQLLCVEIIKNDVKILFDGGGFQDRHSIMLELLQRSFNDFPANKRLKFWIFTGDNRPANHINHEPLFSISGARISQDFVIPDPYSLRWPHANVFDFYQYCEKIKQNSLSKNKILPKVIWRGSKQVNPIRKFIVEKFENAKHHLFDVKHVDDKNPNDFIDMLDLIESAILLELPGGGFSGRMKYLLHSCRPLLVVEREQWDHATISLEPGIHFISTPPDIEFIFAYTQKIFKNYDFLLKNSFETCSLITEIMKQKNISKALTGKIQKYV